MNNFYNVILGNIKGEKRKYTYLIDTYKIFINLFRIIVFCISIIITHRIFEICKLCIVTNYF